MVVAAITSGFSATASAHASLETKTAPVGSHYKAVMRIGHGCEGSSTHTVRIQLPPEVLRAKPMPKAGWTLETVKEKLDKPFDYYGKTINEDVREIIWSAGNLPDDYYDEFVFSAKLAGQPGQTIHLKTFQECSQGDLQWIEIPAEGQDPHDLKAPAPALKLVDKHHDH
ncbi:DUF1775 domain-containing protein [Amphritea balenae]|uniref:DUF1775 domain-containing protein n=1 Tax=Amphritea balenae TaxID=452629 RepID=A0A3P1SQA3_9GAMM|nr:DUF1775 domain-containing protein [Amphritea balenae]